jgi:serine/threonine protein phosphatase 1
MGDIHGGYRALIQCLERSGFDYHGDQLIQLGDIADGFNEVSDCVEELLKIKSLVAIRGNHDEWFREFIETGYHPANWGFGGIATAKSYLKLSHREHLYKKVGEGYKTALDNKDISPAHRRFFERQQLYFIDTNNNCFVHAGFNRLLAFSKQRPANFYWDRELWTEALAHHILSKKDPGLEPFYNISGFHEIFIGHTPTIKWKTDKPMRAINILNVDTGAGHSGRLTILDIHTKEYWQSDPVGELYGSNTPELMEGVVL